MIRQYKHNILVFHWRNGYSFKTSLPSDVLLSKTFPLLRQASLFRCSHIFICSAPHHSLSLYSLLFASQALPGRARTHYESRSVLNRVKAPQKEIPSTLSKVFLFGAPNRNRTDDLILTMDALCQLSYGSIYWSG